MRLLFLSKVQIQTTRNIRETKREVETIPKIRTTREYEKVEERRKEKSYEREMLDVLGNAGSTDIVLAFTVPEVATSVVKIGIWKLG